MPKVKVVLKNVIDFSVYVVVRILICIAQAAPLEFGVQIAKKLAWFFHTVLRLRQEIVDENLAHAFPHLTPDQRNAMSFRMWEHLFILVLEIAHVPRKIHETNWRKHITLVNKQASLKAVLSPRPLILVTGHFGNFELGGYALGILGFPTHTVARNLDNHYLDRFLARFRSATGQHLIPKNGGYEQILRVMQDSGTLAFLADQYAGEKGCWVDFFGRPASAHKAIALLAMENDAPVAVCHTKRVSPMHFDMELQAIVDPLDNTTTTANVRAMTQWYTSQLEKAIRAAPDQYWWLHKRWKDPRKNRELKKAA